MTRNATLWLEEADAGRVATVRTDFTDFLRSGGSVSLDEWSAMTPLGRRIATEAGATLDAERRAGLLLDLAAAIREARVGHVVAGAAEDGLRECAAGGAS